MNSRKTRTRLIFSILILLLGIGLLVSYAINKSEYSIPKFAYGKWYRVVDGTKETIYFGGKNEFEYYDENLNSIVDSSCKTYEYITNEKIINIKCKDKVLQYKVIKYDGVTLDILFDTKDVRVFKLEDPDEIGE